VFDEMFEWVFHWLFNFLWCGVDLKQWTIYSALKYALRWKPSFVQGSGRCHAKGYEGSTKWNQSRTQPQRHKEGEGPSVCTSWLFAVRKDNADRRWLREEHVLHISSAPHVPEDWDGSYVVKIAWRYSQEFDYATRLCLGNIIIM